MLCRTIIYIYTIKPWFSSEPGWVMQLTWRWFSFFSLPGGNPKHVAEWWRGLRQNSCRRETAWRPKRWKLSHLTWVILYTEINMLYQGCMYVIANGYSTGERSQTGYPEKRRVKPSFLNRDQTKSAKSPWAGVSNMNDCRTLVSWTVAPRKRHITSYKHVLDQLPPTYLAEEHVAKYLVTRTNAQKVGCPPDFLGLQDATKYCYSVKPHHGWSLVTDGSCNI